MNSNNPAARLLFNFIQGSEITQESSYDVYKRVTGGSEEEFLEFIRTGPKGDTGESAYEQWTQISGNEDKTFAEFMEYLKGPKGDTGLQGLKGDTGATGDKGATGTRGSAWYSGTSITGTSTTGTIFSSSGITSALVNDMYLNTSTLNVYKCTTAGAASTAKWTYITNLKGANGAAAGFGTPTASVDANVGTPSVTVTSSGSNTAKVFNFAFKNLKGEKGDTGPAPDTSKYYKNRSGLAACDLNTISAPGSYVLMESSSYTNCPSDASYSSLIVDFNDAYIVQTIVKFNNQIAYRRSFDGESTWTEWEDLKKPYYLKFSSDKNMQTMNERDDVTYWGNQHVSLHYMADPNFSYVYEPTQYGFLLNMGRDTEVHQIWCQQPSGEMFHRGGNSKGFSKNTLQFPTTNTSVDKLIEYGQTNTNRNWIPILDGTNFNYITGLDHVTNETYSYTAITPNAGDNLVYMGTSTNRFIAFYADKSTILTSDENEKNIISGITDPYESLFMDLNPILYRFKNFGNEAKKHDRIHCGFGAQSVLKSAKQYGLDEMSFAAICRDDLEEPTEDGRTERYGLMYTELIPLNIHMTQKNKKKIDELEDTIKTLSDKINSYEDRIADLEKKLSQALEAIDNQNKIISELQNK